jgi:hypothetical protein
MQVKNTLLALFVSCSLITPKAIPAQQYTRIEGGVGTSVLVGNRFSSATDAGLGARFTYNFTPSVAIDSEFDSYLTNADAARSLQFGGHAISGVIGVKAGIRERKFGIFFKARPGFMSFDHALSSSAIFGSFATKRITHAVLDLGTVAEFYPSARIILWTDIGTFLIRYGDAKLFSEPTPNGVLSVRSTGRVDVPWRVVAGLSYRFGKLQQKQESIPAQDHVAVGIQYSALTLERSLGTVRDESAVGGWFSFNFFKYVGFDSAINFFPRNVRFADFQQGGRIVQVLAGVRSGVRSGRFGIFGKFRPGMQLYTAATAQDERKGTTQFADVAFDAGGILELYLSRHTQLRFDAGNTILLYRARDIIGVDGTSAHIPSFHKGTIELTTGFGVRF